MEYLNKKLSYKLKKISFHTLMEFPRWWNFIKQERKFKLNIKGFEGHLLKLHYNRKNSLKCVLNLKHQLTKHP